MNPGSNHMAQMEDILMLDGDQPVILEDEFQMERPSSPFRRLETAADDTDDVDEINANDPDIEMDYADVQIDPEFDVDAYLAGVADSAPANDDSTNWSADHNDAEQKADDYLTGVADSSPADDGLTDGSADYNDAERDADAYLDQIAGSQTSPDESSPTEDEDDNVEKVAADTGDDDDVDDYLEQVAADAGDDEDVDDYLEQVAADASDHENVDDYLQWVADNAGDEENNTNSEEPPTARDRNMSTPGCWKTSTPAALMTAVIPPVPLPPLLPNAAASGRPDHVTSSPANLRPVIDPTEPHWSKFPKRDQKSRRRQQEAVRKAGPGDTSHDAIMIDLSPPPKMKTVPPKPLASPVSRLPHPRIPAAAALNEFFNPNNHLDARPSFTAPPHVHRLWTHIGIPNPHPRSYRRGMAPHLQADDGPGVALEPPLNSLELIACHHRIQHLLPQMSYPTAASTLLAAAHSKLETDAVAFASISAVRDKLTRVVKAMETDIARARRDAN